MGRRPPPGVASTLELCPSVLVSPLSHLGAPKVQVRRRPAIDGITLLFWTCSYCLHMIWFKVNHAAFQMEAGLIYCGLRIHPHIQHVHQHLHYGGAEALTSGASQGNNFSRCLLGRFGPGPVSAACDGGGHHGCESFTWGKGEEAVRVQVFFALPPGERLTSM